MAGPYISYDSDGNERTGDSTLSADMVAEAAAQGFTIKDVSTGDVVYPNQEND